MWKKIPEPSKPEWSELRRSKHMKLYADEDIEDEIVEILRSDGINIKGARELPGHRGKPDSFHADFAFKEERFLVTRNGKDYWDDRAVPMNQLHGIIVIDADPRDTIAYMTAIVSLAAFVPYADFHVGSKMKISPTGVTKKSLDEDGTVKIRRYRTDLRDPHEWVAE